MDSRLVFLRPPWPSDFWNVNPVSGGTQEACQPCHAPHNKIGGTPDVLWNHKFGADRTSWGDAVNEASLRCLSCHDGTVALDAFGGRAGTSGTEMVNGADPTYQPMLGTDLDNDHPVSVAYTTTSSSTRFWPMYVSTSGTSASVGWAVSTASTSGDLRLTYTAPTGTGAGTFSVECGTCHAVHGKGLTPEVGS